MIPMTTDLTSEHRQAALADRAGLPGPQAGTRAWPLRGKRLARLSSSRDAVHRCLWIPALRKGSDSPLRTMQRRSHRRISPTQRLPTPRISRSDLSVTCRTRSRRSVSCSFAPSLEPCHDVPVVNEPHAKLFYDTVRLSVWSLNIVGIQLGWPL